MNRITLNYLKLLRFLCQKPWKNYILRAFYASVFFLGVFILMLISLRWVNPSFTAFTLQEDWEELEAERYSLREYWVPYDQIPENIKWAVVASEDQRFWQHSGLDMIAIEEAWKENQEGERIRGASTISQQVSKNLFLWPGKSYLRKGMEAGITLAIEMLWPKERIIEMYLNTAEFGVGIYGIGKATEHFFGEPIAELKDDEAARMAAVLPNPKRMKVEPPTPYVKKRKDWILRNMMNLSGIAYYTEPVQRLNGVPIDSIDVFTMPMVPHIRIRSLQFNLDTTKYSGSQLSDSTGVPL